MGSVTPGVAVRKRGRERCALGPGGWTRYEGFESRPVFPRRREDVDDNGARVTGNDRVRRVGRDSPDATGSEASLVVSDAEDDRPFNDHAELFVVVMVFWKLRARLDFDHRERQPLAVDSAGEIPVRKQLRRDRLEFVEGTHAT